jgi:hypothetical protein
VDIVSTLNFDEKLKAALQRLSERGMWRSNYAPVLYRLLWDVGVELPPPHFAGFVPNFVVMSGSSSLMFGLIGWHGDASIASAIVSAIFFGSLFGLAMALYYRADARAHDLPPWSEFAS